MRSDQDKDHLLNHIQSLREKEQGMNWIPITLETKLKPNTRIFLCESSGKHKSYYAGFVHTDHIAVDGNGIFHRLEYFTHYCIIEEPKD